MVFTSPVFLFGFLPAVLLATWAAPAWLRKWILLAASLGFYWWGVQAFVLVVAASTLLDWALGLAIARTHREGRRRAAGWLLAAAVGQNLALLGWFKYAGFASLQLDRLAVLLGAGGVDVLQIALPIGISFFTFEKISYVVDVWRGDVRARRDPTDVLLFVALFPRSIAGPIVRLREIEDRLRRPRPRAEEVQEGALRFAHGLAKKVLIADQVAPIADASFAAAGDGGLGTTAAWVGLLAYTVQLYFDFSGYSDMAVGIALMLGFRLPENFRRPYSAVSMTDFWRRWHMSLTRWFRDYVYRPLGGNRRGPRRTAINLFAVFLLTGLWHGAAWTFVAWGLYHGAWLALERRMGWRALDAPPRRPWLRRGVVVLAVMLGWVLFRAEDLPTAGAYYAALAGFGDGAVPVLTATLDRQAGLALLVGVALIALLPAARSGGRWLTDAAGTAPRVARVATVGVALPVAVALALAGDFSPFLYFRF